jgi:exonuclease III
MCWNVNGLRAALRAGAREYLTQVDADIVALCEVKADEDTVRKEFDLVGEDAGTGGIARAFSGGAPSAPKYHKLWNCCSTKKGESPAFAQRPMHTSAHARM